MKSPISKWAAVAAGAWLTVQSSQAAIFQQQFQDISAEAQVMGLAYALVDLNPDDGIAPQITFRAGLTLEPDETGLNEVYNSMGNTVEAVSLVGHVDNSLAYGWVHDYRFGNLPQAQQDAFIPTDNLLTIGPDGLSSAELFSGNYRSAVRIDRAYMENDAQQAYANGFTQGLLVRSADSALNRISGDLPVNGDGITSFIVPELLDTLPYFELTPNTQVTFSGQLLAHANFAGSYTPEGQTEVYGGAGAMVSVRRRLPSDGQLQWVSQAATEAAFDFQSQTLWATMRYSTTEQSQESLSSAFELVFANGSDASLQGVLDVSTYAAMTFVADLSTVPEPSAYASMALGLLGVAGVVSSRKTARSRLTKA